MKNRQIEITVKLTQSCVAPERLAQLRDPVRNPLTFVELVDQCLLESEGASPEQVQVLSVVETDCDCEVEP